LPQDLANVLENLHSPSSVGFTRRAIFIRATATEARDRCTASR
jgi:hypothetical protein